MREPDICKPRVRPPAGAADAAQGDCRWPTTRTWEEGQGNLFALACTRIVVEHGGVDGTRPASARGGRRRLAHTDTLTTPSRSRGCRSAEAYRCRGALVATAWPVGESYSDLAPELCCFSDAFARGRRLSRPSACPWPRGSSGYGGRAPPACRESAAAANRHIGASEEVGGGRAVEPSIPDLLRRRCWSARGPAERRNACRGRRARRRVPALAGKVVRCRLAGRPGWLGLVWIPAISVWRLSVRV